MTQLDLFMQAAVGDLLSKSAMLQKLSLAPASLTEQVAAAGSTVEAAPEGAGMASRIFLPKIPLVGPVISAYQGLQDVSSGVQGVVNQAVAFGAPAFRQQ
jgi:hypothetical protein